jgi:hypothetical protein
LALEFRRRVVSKRVVYETIEGRRRSYISDPNNYNDPSAGAAVRIRHAFGHSIFQSPVHAWQLILSGCHFIVRAILEAHFFREISLIWEILVYDAGIYHHAPSLRFISHISFN